MNFFAVVSAGDCCDECAAEYSGQVFEAPDDLEMLPPLHPNCRCDSTFFFTEDHAQSAVDRYNPKQDEDGEGEEQTEEKPTKEELDKIVPEDLADMMSEQDKIDYYNMSVEERAAYENQLLREKREEQRMTPEERKEELQKLMDERLGIGQVVKDDDINSYINKDTQRYAENFQGRRADNKIEFGQRFDTETGQPTSPEFKGGEHSVSIPRIDWENKTFYEGDGIIHNHPETSYGAFSSTDIATLMSDGQERTSIVISKDEKWMAQVGEREYSQKEIDRVVSSIDDAFNKAGKDFREEIYSRDEPLKRGEMIEVMNEKAYSHYMDAVDSFSRELDIKIMKF
jgi:hypothetical protein